MSTLINKWYLLGGMCSDILTYDMWKTIVKIRPFAYSFVPRKFKSLFDEIATDRGMLTMNLYGDFEKYEWITVR